MPGLKNKNKNKISRFYIFLALCLALCLAFLFSESVPVNADPLPVNIQTTTLPDGNIGTYYKQNFQITGGQEPYAWTLISGSLPDGLNLEPSDGAIFGTPTVLGTYNFTVQAQDSSDPVETADRALSITINPPLPIDIITISMSDGNLGSSYMMGALNAIGGIQPFTWSLVLGNLPDGLSLESSGVITGTPTTLGTYTFTAQVQDSSMPVQTDSQEISLTINPPLSLDIMNMVLTSGNLGAFYWGQISAVGGIQPYAWSLVSGNLPDGLSLESSGVITGTPTALGTYNFTVQVQDSSMPVQTDSQEIFLTIDPPLPAPPVSVFFASSGSNGPENTPSAPVEVDLNQILGVDVTVDYAVVGGTATGGGVDYNLPAGTLTIPAGSTSADIFVGIVDDDLSESDETIEITLFNPTNAGLGQSTYTFTILDNDASVISAPQNLTAVGVTDGVQLNWEAPENSGPGFNYYKIYRGEEGAAISLEDDFNQPDGSGPDPTKWTEIPSEGVAVSIAGQKLSIVGTPSSENPAGVISLETTNAQAPKSTQAYVDVSGSSVEPGSALAAGLGLMAGEKSLLVYFIINDGSGNYKLGYIIQTNGSENFNTNLASIGSEGKGTLRLVFENGNVEFFYNGELKGTATNSLSGDTNYVVMTGFLGAPTGTYNVSFDDVSFSSVDMVYSPLDTVSHPTLTYTNTAGTSGTKYYYKVTAVDSEDAEGPDSNVVSLVFSSISAPQNLTAAEVANGIQLNWETPANTGSGLNHYKIYRGTTQGTQDLASDAFDGPNLDSQWINYSGAGATVTTDGTLNMVGTQSEEGGPLGFVSSAASYPAATYQVLNLEADLKLNSGGSAMGLMGFLEFGQNGPENGIIFGPAGTWFPAGEGLGAYIKLVGGEAVDFATVDGSPLDGQFHTYKIVYENGSASLYLDGAEKASGIDVSMSDIKPALAVMGFNPGDSLDINFDNFSLTGSSNVVSYSFLAVSNRLVPTFTDITGISGTKYYYKVTAVDAEDAEGPASGTVSEIFPNIVRRGGLSPWIPPAAAPEDGGGASGNNASENGNSNNNANAESATSPFETMCPPAGAFAQMSGQSSGAISSCLETVRLVKGSGSTVYYVDAGGERHIFPSAEVYFTWFSDFSLVKTISNIDLALMPLGKNVTARAGVKLVKFLDSSKVYAVEPGGILRWIDSEERAAALFGENWTRRVIEIDLSLRDDYAIGESVATDFHPAASLIKYADSSDVYYIDKGQKRRVSSEAAFMANVFQWSAISTVGRAISYPDGLPIVCSEAGLMAF
jgi:fibronectin type 3 domain-containing protein